MYRTNWIGQTEIEASYEDFIKLVLCEHINDCYVNMSKSHPNTEYMDNLAYEVKTTA